MGIHHKVANEIARITLETNSTIALENLKGIRAKIDYSREKNGRLHRWSFRMLQQIPEYKAKLNGVEVVHVNPHKTSSLYLTCRRKISPNRQKLLKCKCTLKLIETLLAAGISV